MYASRANIFEPLAAERSEGELLRLRCDSQSLSYYGDISRFLSARILGFETVSLLDVGPRTGAGLALLRLLHHPDAFTRLKLNPVVGIDLDPAFESIACTEFKDVRAVTGDVLDVESKSFDIVTCSHTIQHVDNMSLFVEQLERIARRGVVLACPFEEREPASGAPIRRITRDWLADLGYGDHEIYDSFHFQNGLCCLAYKPLSA